MITRERQDYQNRWVREHRANDSRYHKKQYDKVRQEMLNHYGNVCCMCGQEVDYICYRFPVEDIRPRDRYYWAKREGYPKGIEPFCSSCKTKLTRAGKW